MNDSNLGIKQPSISCTNQSFMHPPRHNGDVLSGRRELVGDSSTTIEILLSACGDEGSTKFKKCISNKWILANSFLQPIIKLIKLLVPLHCYIHPT